MACMRARCGKIFKHFLGQGPEAPRFTKGRARARARALSTRRFSHLIENHRFIFCILFKICFQKLHKIYFFFPNSRSPASPVFALSLRANFHANVKKYAKIHEKILVEKIENFARPRNSKTPQDSPKTRVQITIGGPFWLWPFYQKMTKSARACLGLPF